MILFYSNGEFLHDSNDETHGCYVVVLFLFYKYGKDGDFTGLSVNCDNLRNDCCFEQFKEELKHHVIIKRTMSGPTGHFCSLVSQSPLSQMEEVNNNIENLSMWY